MSVVVCVIVWWLLKILYDVCENYKLASMHDLIKKDTTNQKESTNAFENEEKFEKHFKSLIDDMRLFKKERKVSKIKIPILMLNNEQLTDQQVLIEVPKKHSSFIGKSIKSMKCISILNRVEICFLLLFLLWTFIATDENILNHNMLLTPFHMNQVNKSTRAYSVFTFITDFYDVNLSSRRATRLHVPKQALMKKLFCPWRVKKVDYSIEKIHWPGNSTSVSMKKYLLGMIEFFFKS